MPSFRSEKVQRPPRLHRLPLRTTGPKGLGLQKEPQRIGGPGVPPPGFQRGNTSLDEWAIYWASAKIFNDPVDPHKPPFYGGRAWSYQKIYTSNFGMKGITSVDFVYYLPGEIVAARVQGIWVHTARGADTFAYDEAQRTALERRFRVVDFYSQDFIGDASGRAAIEIVLEGLGGRERLNPVTSGTYQVVRPQV